MAMDDDDPLDFEKEDSLLKPTPPLNKRRKIIGLDDLLNDFYAEQSKLASCQFKKASSSKIYDSDEDVDRNEREKQLSRFVDDCEKQVNDMKTEDETPFWGQRIFGHQKPMPSIMSNDLASCELLQSSSIREYDLIIDADVQGEGFLEGLLINGWLSKLAFVCASVDNSLATWTFDKLLYSSNVDVQVSAYEFWHDILLARNESDELMISLGWLPNYCKLKEALEIYGYLSDTSVSNLSPSKADLTASKCEGPPGNISSWIKVLSICCQIRSFRAIFSSAEAQELLGVVIHLLLDRQLQGLSVILDECMQSIINFFSEKEWEVSCKEVAESLARRVPKDFNCLRVVECISAANERSRQLRNQMALQILIICFDKKVTGFKDIVKLLLKVNIKDKNFHFFNLYIKLVLAENFLLSSKPDQEISEMWYKFLRKCSSQITSTDWRPYASKVRNKASYLLQSSSDKRSN